MEKLLYSVFYQSFDGFFVWRTDFNELDQAKEFLKSKVFLFDGVNFHFILKDEMMLILIPETITIHPFLVTSHFFLFAVIILPAGGKVATYISGFIYF